MAVWEEPAVLEDEYETVATVRFRYGAGNPKDAAIWRERLRSDAVKLSVFAFRKLGLSFEVELGETRKVGRRRRS